MENTEGLIKVFVSGNLPKTKYTDANELAKDLADILAIDQEKLVVDLINLPDIKGEKGDKGDRGVAGATGGIGPTGATGPGFTFEGDWALAQNYTVGDVVNNDGTLYICILANASVTDNEPGVGVDEATYWSVYLQSPIGTYIEGTWTPAVTAASGTAPTFAVKSGTYTQIGDTVFCQVSLVNATGGTQGAGSGQLSVDLPVAASSSQINCIRSAGQSLNGASKAVVMAEVPASASTVKLWLDVSTAITGGDFSDANIREIRFEFQYKA